MLLKLKLRFCNAFWGLELCKTPEKYLNVFYKKSLILLTNEGIHQKTFGVKPHRLDPILTTVGNTFFGTIKPNFSTMTHIFSTMMQIFGTTIHNFSTMTHICGTMTHILRTMPHIFLHFQPILTNLTVFNCFWPSLTLFSVFDFHRRTRGLIVGRMRHFSCGNET